MPYFTNDRIVAWFWLFGLEGPAAVSAMYYLYNNTFSNAVCPSSEVDRFVWVSKHLCTVALPSFVFLWGCMRSFDSDTKAEDPFAGVETKRWQKFQKILTNNTEQGLLFSPSIISLALLVPAENWALVPTLLTSYVLGRFLFGVGYFLPTFPGNMFAPLFTLEGWGRSPGMNLTLYSTFFALNLSLYFLYNSY